MDKHETLNRVCLGVSIAAAAAYLPSGHVLAKGLTFSTLALLAFRSGQPLLGMALAFGSLGDVLLDLDPKRLFVFGLGLSCWAILPTSRCSCGAGRRCAGLRRAWPPPPR